jgi:hypothetical protein
VTKATRTPAHGWSRSLDWVGQPVCAIDRLLLLSVGVHRAIRVGAPPSGQEGTPVPASGRARGLVALTALWRRRFFSLQPAQC